MEKIRVQIDFSEKALQRLDELKEQLGCSSRAGTVRAALVLLGWLLKRTADGYTIVARKEGKEEIIPPEALLK